MAVICPRCCNFKFRFITGGPSWQVHLYTEASRSQTIIVLRFHSGGLDRPSSHIVVLQFLTALNAVVDGRTVSLFNNPGKDVLVPTIEELVPKGKSSKGFFQKASDTVGYAFSANKYAVLPFQPSYGEQKKEPFKSDILTYTLGKAGMFPLSYVLPIATHVNQQNVIPCLIFNADV